ncbi:conjugal transfer protein TrbL [Tessaracoccus sp. MC1679]|uniref:conjugal transfer protein TrbL n=1 Tax=Tessaracoccus sp. MC1679 TaxID=2760313 RepID=UPI001C7298FE
MAGEAAATLVSAPFDWIASAIGAAAGWMFESVWAIFDTTTLVDVTSPAYVGVYNILFGIAVFLMLIFFCFQLIGGLIRRDPTALSKAALGLAKSVLGSFLVITLTATLLEVTDQLSVGIVQATGTTMEEMGGRIAALAIGLTAVNIAAPGAGAIVTIFLAGLAISAAALVWFTLLIRKALLLVAIVMAPIALSGFSWEATRGWFTKWASFVLALIFSKLVIVVVFLVATAQVSAPIDFDLASIADPIAGIVLMFVAAFAPYMAYKFISFIGFDMYHSMSVEQEAKGALNRPVPVSGGPRSDGVKKVLDGGDGTTSPSSRGSTGGAGTPGKPGTSPAGGATGGPASSTGSGAGASESGAGGGTAAGAGAAAGAAVTAAKAGPKAGKKVGTAAEEHTDASQQASDPPPTPPAQPSTSPRRSPSRSEGGASSAPADQPSPRSTPPERPVRKQPPPTVEPRRTDPKPGDGS